MASSPPDQASQVFRTHLASLIKEIQLEPYLCDELYSASIIGEDEYIAATDDKHKEKDKFTRPLLFKTLKSIRSNDKNFEVFCDLLEKSEIEVNRNWGSRLRNEAKDSDSDREDSSGKENVTFQMLNDQLSVLKRGLVQSDENVEEKLQIMKEFITKFITTSIEAQVSDKELTQQLNKLCYHDMAVPANLVDWTFAELKRLRYQNKKEEKSDTVQLSSSTSDSKTQEVPLSFNDHVHNCLLLCKVVGSYDRSNYSNFLSSHSHSFDEVSFSHPTDDEIKLTPYIIAKIESKSEIYIVFRGEPRFDVWQEKYSTFSEGISFQLSQIPIRFFIEQIRNGYKIYLSGFSMGGLLALSVYASLWKDTCLSINNLLQNVFCITFGTPLVPLEELEMTLKSVRDMEKNSHIFIMEDDVIPRLLQFVEVKSVKKSAQNDIGAQIFNQLVSYVRQKSASKNATTLTDITDLKRLLLENVIRVDTKIFGNCHYIFTDFSSVSIVLLRKIGAVTERLKFPDCAELEQIAKDRDIMIQHSLLKYETSLIKAKFLQPLAETAKPVVFKEVAALKPDLSSITFYRHGDEIALVLQGENLWFCSKIKITSKSGSRVIDTVGADASSRSIHFNYVPRDKNDLLIEINAETADIVCYSHFAKSIRKNKLPVECKGEYRVTFRQRQVAKLTPEQVIVVSFLSALLEVMEYSRASSRRYRAILKFFEEAVRIVPLESVFYAIALDSDENAWKCANAFVSSDVTIPPSHMLSESLSLAFFRLCGITPTFLQDIQGQALFHHMMRSGPFPPPLDMKVHVTNNNISVSVHAVNNPDQPLSSFSFQMPQNSTTPNSKKVLDSIQRCKQQVNKLVGRKNRILCDLNIDVVYSSKRKSLVASEKLPSPISVLKEGRERLLKLQEEANEEVSQLLGHTEEKKEFNNEKMISTLDSIFTNELSLCAYVLGAFMQQQIRVPFLDSPLDTAHILQSTESPPAVGVWALFCLKMIDFEKMTKARKGKALIVKVEKYIKGILAKGNEQRQTQLHQTFEDFYAGKLQFLMQCLSSSVSCNTNYISYSLERQLADLCDKCDITPNTRVQMLISLWNVYFKKNLLLYVTVKFRPIVARWILWCLSIHHLRERLAEHITVGIIGLSNSGKSCLVNRLFKQKVISGTTTMERTTVPFLYNLEGLVDGLDVIDFPGMDDKDENVFKISQILFNISQLIIFVVDYRRYYTVTVSKWVEVLKNEGLPVLICLTHADKLYATTCLNDKGNPKCTNDEAKRLISQQLEKICESLQQPPSWKVNLYCFSKDPDSSLSTKLLKDVGISFSDDVGAWIEHELRNYMKQSVIADRLKQFLSEFKMTNAADDLPPDVRGLEVISETRFDVPQEGIKFKWEGHGLQITFHPNKMRATSQCFVKVISSGKYKLPDNAELVSSLYWIWFPEEGAKSVDIEIQHCCPPSQSEQNGVLCFIKGNCEQNLPYTFSAQKNGLFSKNDQKGFLSTQSFGILGIIRYSNLTNSDDLPPINSSTLCVLKVYSKYEGSGEACFDFVFMKDLDSFRSATDKKYQESGWSLYLDCPFVFDSVSLSANIAEDLDFKGWNLKRSSEKITQNSILNCYCPEKSPKDSLQFQWFGKNSPINISFPVKIYMDDTSEKESVRVTLSLPLVNSEVLPESAPSPLQRANKSLTLSSSNAIKLLRENDFSVTHESCNLLMTELGLKTDHKKRLMDRPGKTDYFMALEEAIDWWISNEEHASWDILINAVAKLEKYTAEKMKTFI